MDVKDVVGALIEREGFVLLAQRACENLNGKWEFPGGKVKSGETHADALRREIDEELGISIDVGGHAGSHKFHVGQKSYCLHVYWAVIEEGTPAAHEHQALVWTRLANLLDYDLAPADVPIAVKLQNSVT